MKMILKKEININRENIIIWNSFIKIEESSFTGRNPPEEIIDIAKFNELKYLIPKIFKVININIQISGNYFFYFDVNIFF